MSTRLSKFLFAAVAMAVVFVTASTWADDNAKDATKEAGKENPAKPDDGKLPPFPGDDAARLCRLVIMKMLPAVAEEDIMSFGAAIKEIQECLGGYFAAAQGGSPFTSPDVAAVLAAIDREGAYGIGQSSWGPTGFAFSATPAQADRLTSIARQHPQGRALDIRVCAGFNHAAEIAVNSVDVRVQ